MSVFLKELKCYVFLFLLQPFTAEDAKSKEMKYEYEEKTVPLSKIDLRDTTCRLGISIDADSVVESIEAVGLINPPVLAGKGGSMYRIVCGFRRVKACQILGWPTIPARVLPGVVPLPDLLKLAILDNRAHRCLNVIEQARGIHKLTAYIHPGNEIEVLAPLLGFPPNKKVFTKISTLVELPDEIQAGILDETISFEVAVDLCKFTCMDAISFFDLFKKLKLSRNKQREIIALVGEIAVREGIWPAEILQCQQVSDIMENHDLNRNEKGSKLRAYLKQRRFPELARAEETFRESLKELKLGSHLHLTPPPYFEGDTYSLRMTFKSLEDFNRCRRDLEAISKKAAFRKILTDF